MEGGAQTVHHKEPYMPEREGDDGSSSMNNRNQSLELSMATSGILVQGDVEHLVAEALAWASLHGLVVGDPSAQSSGRTVGLSLVHAPISLLPTPFPEEKYKQAVELAPLFNELVDRVSMDYDFLQEALSKTRKVDPFTARLLDIHSLILQDGVKQDVRLGLHRSDYMVDMATGDLLQVELNTISSSFAGLGTLVSQLHSYLVAWLKRHSGLLAEKIPENRALDGFAEALALGFKEYGDPSAYVLTVVQQEERNMYDQHWLKFRLYKTYGVKMIRKTLAEVDLQAKILQDGTLVIGEQKVAIVYYRAGYAPNDYPSEAEWRARKLIEQSTAIKCPSISYHLVGTKRIQQELAKPGILERYMQDTVAVSKLRRCFAGLWGLEGDACSSILDEAIARPGAFVLKPQREGGGNNVYGDEIREKLMELKGRDEGEGLAAYILMQKIFPAVHNSYFVRAGNCRIQQAISELGIFSAYIRKNSRLILNQHCGYLLRTKASGSNEGGVAAGYAVLDSLYCI